MIFDYRSFLYFQTIVKEHSVSKAADKLYISQSSLSKFLKIIEDEVGAKLINRNTIPLTLTPAGEKFLQYMEQSAAMYEKAMLEISQIGTEKAREIHIGASAMNSSMISDVFPEFYNRYPNIQLMLHEENYENLSHMLSRKKLDMALLVRSGIDINNTTDIFDIIISQPRLIVVSKQNSLASLITGSDNSIDNPQHIDIHLLKNQKLIAGKSGQRIYEDINELVKKKFIPVQGFLETQTIDTMVSFTINNYGISFIPALYLKSYRSLDDLVFFYSNYPELQWALALEYRSPTPSIPERYFATILKRVCNRLNRS